MTPRPETYAGLFLVTFATLMYEILLTRIFSVTMWHHFAFMSISVAMFGLSLGAVMVHLLPKVFTDASTHARLAQSAALFAVTIVLSFLTHLSIPFSPRPNLVVAFAIALTYVALALPFTFSGICVCLALTRFPASINGLYAVDLAGAAAGCFAVLLLLNSADGPSAVLLVAAVAGIGAIVFGWRASSRRFGAVAFVGSCLLCIAGIGNALLAARQRPALFIAWAKGAPENRPLFERWNALGRVQVAGDPTTPKHPYHFGLGSRYVNQIPVRELELTVDATSVTILTHVDGSFAGLSHLKYLVMNIAQYLKSDGDVLVLGTGGGRDILSSLAFGQRSIVGVELNRGVLAAVHDTFGDFTGHLERDPRVRLVNDDARSFVYSTSTRFDIIQIVSIGGVFVLLEQPLYTVEAWDTYLDRLKPGGILSVSRVYAPNGAAELYRATSLAYAALRKQHAADPRRHLVVIRSDPSRLARSDTFGTLLVCKDPFSDSQLDTIESVSAQAGFEVVLSPRASTDPVFAELASRPPSQALMRRLSLDLSPSTDNRPFFFNVLRFEDLFQTTVWRNRTLSYNLQALAVLSILLIVVAALSAACILIPLHRVPIHAPQSTTTAAATYFTTIGLGFILIEMTQLQLLTMFLGHPTYGLGVVLATLLIAGGIGSYLTKNLRFGRLRLILLLLALALFALFSPVVLRHFAAARTSTRIIAAILLVAPLGLMMGMPLPLGMKAAEARSRESTPWLWGINGAASVCGSVIATILALRFGIALVAWVGVASYAVATIAFWRLYPVGTATEPETLT